MSIDIFGKRLNKNVTINQTNNLNKMATINFINDLPGERWEAIPYFSKMYMVSDHGRLKTWTPASGERLLKPQTTGGYQFFRFYDYSGKGHTQYLHRLVGSAFCEGYDETKHDIDHRDTDKTHNHYSNLHWVTEKENSNNPLTLMKRTTPVLQCAPDGYVIALWPSVRNAARETGISEMSISCSSEKRIMRCGFYWICRKPVKHRNK